MSQPPYIDILQQTLSASGASSYQEFLRELHPNKSGGPGYCFSCESVVAGDNFIQIVPFNEMGWLCTKCGSDEVHGVMAIVQLCRDAGVIVD